MELSLRLLLLLFGAAMVAFIIWDGKRRLRPKNEDLPLDNDEPMEDIEFIEPVLEEGSLDGIKFESSEISEEAIQANTPAQYDTVEPIEHIVLNVMALDNQSFAGPDLMQLILGLGLRFGDMNIFHRHESANGTGNVQFSLANAVEPGTFDLQTMAAFSTQGVVLFMQVDAQQSATQAFNLMLETAQKLADGLDGVVLNQYRETIDENYVSSIRHTLQTMEANWSNHAHANPA